MTQADTPQKPALQIFLEETIALLGLSQVLSSQPRTVRVLLLMWQKGWTPEDAAAHYRETHRVHGLTDFEEQLMDARDGLRNHAYLTEQEIRKISERITESMESGGPVTGLLNVSLSAQGLYRLKGVLDIYQDFASLLDTLYESTGSAQLALAVAKEDVMARLVNMPEATPNSETAGALEALKRTFKILTNTL